MKKKYQKLGLIGMCGIVLASLEIVQPTYVEADEPTTEMAQPNRSDMGHGNAVEKQSLSMTVNYVYISPSKGQEEIAQEDIVVIAPNETSVLYAKEIEGYTVEKGEEVAEVPYTAVETRSNFNGAPFYVTFRYMKNEEESSDEFTGTYYSYTEDEAKAVEEAQSKLKDLLIQASRIDTTLYMKESVYDVEYTSGDLAGNIESELSVNKWWVFTQPLSYMDIVSDRHTVPAEASISYMNSVASILQQAIAGLVPIQEESGEHNSGEVVEHQSSSQSSTLIEKKEESSNSVTTPPSISESGAHNSGEVIEHQDSPEPSISIEKKEELSNNAEVSSSVSEKRVDSLPQEKETSKDEVEHKLPKTGDKENLWILLGNLLLGTSLISLKRKDR